MVTIEEARATMEEAGYEWDGLDEFLRPDGVPSRLLQEERLLVVPPGEVFDAEDYIDKRGLSTERLTVVLATFNCLHPTFSSF